jgi:hypothetical protein
MSDEFPLIPEHSGTRDFSRPSCQNPDIDLPAGLTARVIEFRTSLCLNFRLSRTQRDRVGSRLHVGSLSGIGASNAELNGLMSTAIDRRPEIQDGPSLYPEPTWRTSLVLLLESDSGRDVNPQRVTVLEIWYYSADDHVFFLNSCVLAHECAIIMRSALSH